MEHFRDCIKMTGVLDKALAGAMGDRFYIARVATQEELDDFVNYINAEV